MSCSTGTVLILIAIFCLFTWYFTKIYFDNKTKKKFCPKCKVQEGIFGKFCNQCGSKLKEKFISERWIK